jgi:hypothetical protein
MISTSSEHAPEFHTTSVPLPLMVSGDPLPLLVASLSRLPPNCTRESWELVGYAIFDMTGGWDVGYYLFRDWSRRGRRHRNLKLIGTAWARFAGLESRESSLDTLRVQLRRAGHDLEEVRAESGCYRMFQEGSLAARW